MTVYSPQPAYADKSRHPKALLLIVAAHAAALAAVLTAKMDLPAALDPTVTKVTLVPEDPVPPENPPPPRPAPEPGGTTATPVPAPAPPPEPVISLGETIAIPMPGPIIEPGTPSEPAPRPAPVRTGPRFDTPDRLVKPPYPASKIRSDEQAVLRLRLTIDERGRVTAVEPVGRADPVFLSAARRHLIAHWRYRPAREDGRVVASSTVITLRFELN